MPLPTQRTTVYVDGFNLYYGALKGTSYRWLDLDALCRRFLKPSQELTTIKYFTAKVQAREGDGEQAVHQRAYLRALRTIPHLSIYYGRFLRRTATRMLENPPASRNRTGRRDSGLRSVWITEEKGSDVNLASHLLADGFRARYDLALVISNDGDLKMPIEIVRRELRAPVGVLNPHSNRSWALSPRQLPRGSFYRRIRESALRHCQFPGMLSDGEGEIHCPKGWTEP